MRFETKFDGWLTALLVTYTFVAFAVAFSRVPVIVAYLPLAIWVISVALMLPQYYEVRSEGLFVRQGLRAVEIPWPTVQELISVHGGQSARVFSMERMHVVTSDGKRFIISPRDRSGFLEAVAGRCPQLVRNYV